MTEIVYPVEWSNRNYDRDVENHAEQVMDRVEEALRRRVGDIAFSMSDTLTARTFDKEGRLVQPMKIRVSVGPTTAVSLTLGYVRGDYAEGMDFIPRLLFDWDIERIVQKILRDLSIVL